MRLGVQGRWWFGLLVWEHEAFTETSPPAKDVGVWVGVLLPRDVHGGEGHPLEGVCTVALE